MSLNSKARIIGDMKTALRQYQIKISLILLTALTLLIATSAFASYQQLPNWEIWLLVHIYHLPAQVTLPMYLLTQLGNICMVLVAAVIAWVLKRKSLAKLVLFNGFMAYVLAILIKEIVQRPRPALLLSEIVPRFDHSIGPGFPSGHTAVATVLALTLWPKVPTRFRWLLVAWMGIVAFSRIYLGVHSPLDIVGGFCIGVIVALGAKAINDIYNTTQKA